jgi:hypothetical protein
VQSPGFNISNGAPLKIAQRDPGTSSFGSDLFHTNE